MNVPVSGVTPVSEMRGEDEDETRRLRDMEARARDFITSFNWCTAVLDLYFGDGIGDVFAVFFARIKPARPSVDEYLWIVVGDIPPAYLVIDDSPTPKAALECYIREMRKWVALAKDGKSSRDVIPVNVPATPQWAGILESRLNALEQKMIPIWFTVSEEGSPG
ncbi:MAG: hypothetical protein ACLGSD_16400 [Acidobacteriota bacterium]